MFEIYGSACVCCGESQKRFLTLDHVNNDGAEHRKRITGRSVYPFYRGGTVKVKLEAVKAERRRDDLQILCFNCNCGRQHNGGICPHEIERRDRERSESSSLQTVHV